VDGDSDRDTRLYFSSNKTATTNDNKKTQLTLM